jgi:predicted nucleic acid-binding Zn ribbon protein
MKGFGLEDSSRLADIQKAWPDLAGKTNAEQSRPGKLEGGVLCIYVDHHMWLNELKRTLAPMLLKKLQERFGKKNVKRLRFEITPEEGGE